MVPSGKVIIGLFGSTCIMDTVPSGLLIVCKTAGVYWVETWGNNIVSFITFFKEYPYSGKNLNIITWVVVGELSLGHDLTLDVYLSTEVEFEGGDALSGELTLTLFGCSSSSVKTGNKSSLPWYL